MINSSLYDPRASCVTVCMEREKVKIYPKKKFTCPDADAPKAACCARKFIP